MAKVVRAVTAIDHGNDTGKYHYEPGDPLEIKQFTKEQLKDLFDSGAIEMEDAPDAPAVGPDTSVTQDQEETKQQEEENPEQ